MPTEQSPQRQFLERQLRHFVRQFEGMGARITLLAQALDIPLGTASELSAVLQCDGLAAQRQAGREARMREELRGLLVLRYRVFAGWPMTPTWARRRRATSCCTPTTACCAKVFPVRHRV